MVVFVSGVRDCTATYVLDGIYTAHLVRIAWSSHQGPSKLASRLAHNFNFVVIQRRGRYVLVEQFLHMSAGTVVRGQPSPAAQQDNIPRPLDSSAAPVEPLLRIYWLADRAVSSQPGAQSGLSVRGIHDSKYGDRDPFGRKSCELLEVVGAMR